MCGLLVHANQKSPIGRMREPRIMGGRRSSGMTLPCFFILRANRVLVIILILISGIQRGLEIETYVIVTPPQRTPIIIPRKGRAPTP